MTVDCKFYIHTCKYLIKKKKNLKFLYYQGKCQGECQSAYFAHTSFNIFTADVCIRLDGKTDKISIFIVGQRQFANGLSLLYSYSDHCMKLHVV